MSIIRKPRDKRDQWLNENMRNPDPNGEMTEYERRAARKLFKRARTKNDRKEFKKDIKDY